MEQLVARRAHNPKVTGSSPVPATLREDASASFCVLNYLAEFWAHIRRGGHRFASSRYIERGCFGILFLFRTYTGFGATGLHIILPNLIFSLNFFNHVHCLRFVQQSI